MKSTVCSFGRSALCMYDLHLQSGMSSSAGGQAGDARREHGVGRPADEALSCTAHTRRSFLSLVLLHLLSHVKKSNLAHQLFKTS